MILNRIKLGGIVLISGMMLAPSTTMAASTFKQIVDTSLVPLGNKIVYIIYALAFLFFFFGMFRYFFASGAKAEESRSKGKQFMIWSFIGLAVLFTVWGLVNILLNLLKSWA